MKWKRIDSTDYFINEFGDAIVNSKTKRLIKCHLNSKGYPSFRMPAIKYCRPVHKIIADLWHGKSKLQVNHKDGDKLNNAFFNFDFMTCKENINHAIKLGLRKKDINLKSGAILTDIQVAIIKSKLFKGYSNEDLAKTFGVHHSTISKIRTGKNWSHVIADESAENLIFAR